DQDPVQRPQPADGRPTLDGLRAGRDGRGDATRPPAPRQRLARRTAPHAAAVRRRRGRTRGRRGRGDRGLLRAGRLMSKITPVQLARLSARVDARVHAYGGAPIAVALRYSRDRLAQQFGAAPLPEVVALFYAELAAERELERRKRRDVTT